MFLVCFCCRGFLLVAVQGLLRAKNVNRLTQSGVKFVFYVADYFAVMNNKLDGDIDKIRACFGRLALRVRAGCFMNEGITGRTRRAHPNARHLRPLHD